MDYETTKSYNLIVTATDKGASPLSADINVYIYVTDVNDNNPVFGPAVYNATFSENVINGTVCATVVATDADDGENKDIMYTIVGGNEENKFTIDMVSLYNEIMTVVYCTSELLLTMICLLEK